MKQKQLHSPNNTVLTVAVYGVVFAFIGWLILSFLGYPPTPFTGFRNPNTTSPEHFEVALHQVNMTWNQINPSPLSEQDSEVIVKGVFGVREITRAWPHECWNTRATKGYLNQYLKGERPNLDPTVKSSFDQLCGGDIDARGKELSDKLADLKKKFESAWNDIVDVIFAVA